MRETKGPDRIVGEVLNNEYVFQGEGVVHNDGEESDSIIDSALVA